MLCNAYQKLKFLILDTFEGDGILKDTLEKMETLNMDMVWDVLDWYQNAIILTRGNDVELEAEITARIGYVYDKVRKSYAKS